MTGPKRDGGIFQRHSHKAARSRSYAHRTPVEVGVRSTFVLGECGAPGGRTKKCVVAITVVCPTVI
jgi:hypothetical protein